MYDAQSQQQRKNLRSKTVENKKENHASLNETVSDDVHKAVVQPEYCILYQQKVRAEDVYLGVDFTRYSSVASSEAVVVKVELPLLGNANDISIDLQPFHIKLSAPHYHLSTPLPIQINVRSETAK